MPMAKVVDLLEVVPKGGMVVKWTAGPSPKCLESETNGDSALPALQVHTLLPVLRWVGLSLTKVLVNSSYSI